MRRRAVRNLVAIPFLLPFFLACFCAAVLLALFLWLDDMFFGLL
jgi:hypothetical protein